MIAFSLTSIGAVRINTSEKRSPEVARAPDSVEKLRAAGWCDCWLVHERGIEPHIPVIDKSIREDGALSRGDFTYDHGSDIYRCPEGKEPKRHRRALRKERRSPAASPHPVT